MTQTQINLLITERTALRDAAQNSLDEALAMTPDPSYRYRVDISGVTPITSQGLITEPCQINGEFVNPGAGVNGSPVHVDASHLGNAVYETNSTCEEAPPPVVVVWGENNTSTDWTPIIP